MKIIDIDAKDYEQKYNIYPLLAKLLKASELSDDYIKELLSEGYSFFTCEAECIKQVSKRILSAKEHKEKIYIVGDYDADGICATAIMKILLDKLKIENDYYIPDRFKDGYGLNVNIVDKANAEGADLIITVDNGVRALDAIARSKELSIDIVITDHHVMVEEINDVLVVHPKYMGEGFEYLCGAGVAFEISKAMIGLDKKSLALACVASVGDVMVLSKETRNIVKAGLKVLNGKYPLSLYLLNGDERITGESIGFQIAPKINCVGRLADIADANSLPVYLSNDDEVYVYDVIEHINDLNNLRKEMTNKQISQATKLVNDDPFIIVSKESFHEGINGIVASRLTEKFNKPSLVMTKKDDIYKGSARSIEGINIMEILNKNHYIFKYGGHSMAAGISVKVEDYDNFYREIQKETKSLLDRIVIHEKKYLNLVPEDLSVEYVKDLQRIEPKPKEISEILFAINGKHVYRYFDNEKTVNMYLECVFGNTAEAVLFKNGEYYKENGFSGIHDGDYLLGRLYISEYQGRTKIKFYIDEIKPVNN